MRQRENLQLATGLRSARLTLEQSRKIHEATLEILERVGARLYSQEALDMMTKAGVRSVMAIEPTFRLAWWSGHCRRPPSRSRCMTARASRPWTLAGTAAITARAPTASTL